MTGGVGVVVDGPFLAWACHQAASAVVPGVARPASCFPGTPGALGQGPVQTHRGFGCCTVGRWVHSTVALARQGSVTEGHGLGRTGGLQCRPVRSDQPASLVCCLCLRLGYPGSCRVGLRNVLAALAGWQ